jgi:uncharacterized membrane protein (DUF2068 family)
VISIRFLYSPRAQNPKYLKIIKEKIVRIVYSTVALWKKGIQEIFLQNLFLYYYLKFKKFLIFHAIVRNTFATGFRYKSASGFRWKIRNYELFLKILLTFGTFSNKIWISFEEKVLASLFITVHVYNIIHSKIITFWFNSLKINYKTV